MILSYYGRKTSISEIHKTTGVGRDGLSALSMVQAARRYGLKVRTISLEAEDFRFVSLPAIIYWQFNHFLVVERWSPNFVDVIDPAVGRERLSAREFDEGFTGVVMMLEPGMEFDTRTAKSSLSLRTYLLQYLKQSPWVFLQIILVSLLLQAFGLVIPLTTKVVIDRIIPYRMLTLIPLLAVGLPLVLVAQLVTMLIRSSLLVYLQARIDASLTSNFFEHLLKLPLRFFQQRSSGDIMSRVASNTTVRNLISSQLVSTILDGSMVIIYLVILLSQAFTFGTIALGIGLIQVLLLISTHGPIRRLARRELDAIGESQGYVTEMLTGVETLKAAGAEQRAFQRWSNFFIKQLNISVRLNYMTNFITTLTSILNIFAPLALLWVGTNAVLHGTMQLGTMLALNVLVGEFLTPLSSLANSGQLLQTARSHIERLADVMEAEPEQHLQNVQQPPRLTGKITLKQVSFQYDPNAPKVLKDIDVQVDAGQKVAIVGRTGSGKSTLGKLLLGLCLPTEGEILYDGIPLQTLDFQSVRAQLGVVMQDMHTFSGSIRQNITFNHPDMDIEQITKATQVAALHEDILQMPMRYETFISEGGNALSGGQRQRLALACALAHEPAILLLDEATSSLDVITERTIEHNLKNLQCTQIIIAHRLSTIRNADCILVLDDGRIVESGSHQDLLAKDGYYAKLIRNQLATRDAETVDAFDTLESQSQPMLATKPAPSQIGDCAK
jgi:ABC-type bacteriocin/lantibiotic exporter with double-glycine peptidase domain